MKHVQILSNERTDWVHSIIFPVHLIVLVLVVLTIGVESGYNQSRDKKASYPMVEVYTSGRGLIMESDRKLLFCRIRPDGSLEYESRDDGGIKLVRSHIDARDIDLINKIITSKGFASVNSFYDQIESLKDAVFTVDVIISHGTSVKKIAIRNYTPSHPRASSAYPERLVELLKEIQRLRPLTDFERRNNLTLELPY